MLQLKNGLKQGSKHLILKAFSQYTLPHPLLAKRFDHIAKTLVNELDTLEDKTASILFCCCVPPEAPPCFGAIPKEDGRWDDVAKVLARQPRFQQYRVDALASQ